MRNLRAITVGAVLAASVGALAQSNVQTTLQDIQATLGSVPDFFKAMPPDALPGAWRDMKAIELSPTTALGAKTKELIGLAVAAQIPCKYCIYFHTLSARANGATDEELREATAISALEREWGTIMNGMELDMRQFRQEANAMVAYVERRQGQPGQPRLTTRVTDAASAYRDIVQTFGFVPTFMRDYPPEGIAGLWTESKALYLSPTTALDGKTKLLIALAVSAQTPCASCLVLDKAFARANGATDREINEAIAMAGLTRHWSTMLNGAQVDERQFRAQVGRLMQDRAARANRSASR